LEKNLSKEPTYSQYKADEFPLEEISDVQVKTIVGEGSPDRLESGITFFEIFMEESQLISARSSKFRVAVIETIQG